MNEYRFYAYSEISIIKSSFLYQLSYLESMYDLITGMLTHLADINKLNICMALFDYPLSTLHDISEIVEIDENRCEKFIHEMELGGLIQNILTKQFEKYDGISFYQLTEFAYQLMDHVRDLFFIEYHSKKKRDRDILNFHGDDRFLSNFYASPMTIGGISFCCNEQWYVYNKTIIEEEREKILKITEPEEVKKFGRNGITHRDDWDAVKIDVMRKGLYAKFTQNAELRDQLIETGNGILQEGNWWGDVFWGVNYNSSKGRLGGKNWLGRLLMELRDIL